MKVLLSGGGTAGHTTPLLAVANKLKEVAPSHESLELFYIGQKGDKNAETISRDASIRRFSIHAGKFRRYHSLSLLRQIFNIGPNLLNLRDAFYVIAGFFESIGLLLKLKPDVIFFKGGFVVVPLGAAARLLRIPFITHDSDVLPGLANRLIAKGARYNAVVHEGVTYYPAHKTVVTGIPVTDEYSVRAGVTQTAYKKKLWIAEDSVHIFVYTGTQGARIVDESLESIVPQLLEAHHEVYITHVFGRLNEHTMNVRYQGLSTESAGRLRRLAFIDNAYDYIASADIIIGRAGATSMAEFATVGRACIIIPAEQLTGGHQLKNAELLQDAGAIKVVHEKDLASSLYNVIDSLVTHKQSRTDLAHSLHAFASQDASMRIAELIVGLYNNMKRHN
jgi:UDP-N-acetylglucosamine--N-acetylmuramyl-(pentapeptide) pyrophosphoryl-undecaprenol N-acetylglucosamine transferase